MSTSKAISGNVNKNDGATVLHAGNIASTRFSNLSLASNTPTTFRYGSRVINPQGGSVAQSGNLGTRKALSNGVFGEMETGKYVGKIIGTRIAQTDNTFLRSGGGEVNGRTGLHYAKGDYRYHITDWSYTTGQATKGGSAGVLFTYVDPETGSATTQEPKPTDAIPGRLVYKEPKLLPVQDTYKPRTG